MGTSSSRVVPEGSTDTQSMSRTMPLNTIAAHNVRSTPDGDLSSPPIPNAAETDTGTFYEAFKNIMPSCLTEFVLFVLLTLSIILFVKLIEYTNIQQYIKETSRCYKNAMFSNYSADVYVIKGYTMNRIEILKITYDFKTKDTKVEIMAPKGEVLNKIKVPLYNIRTRDVDEIEKVFYSEVDYDLLNETMIYEGNPELIQFMQLQSTKFFDKKLEAAKI